MIVYGIEQNGCNLGKWKQYFNIIIESVKHSTLNFFFHFHLL